MRDEHFQSTGGQDMSKSCFVDSGLGRRGPTRWEDVSQFALLSHGCIYPPPKCSIGWWIKSSNGRSIRGSESTRRSRRDADACWAGMFFILFFLFYSYMNTRLHLQMGTTTTRTVVSSQVHLFLFFSFYSTNNYLWIDQRISSGSRRSSMFFVLLFYFTPLINIFG
jgi:hypothetical protein